MKRTTIVLDNGDEIVTDINYDGLVESLSMVTDFIRLVDIGRCRHLIYKAHITQLIEH